MNPRELEKAKAYQRKKYFVALAHLAWQALILATVAGSGVNFVLKGWAESVSGLFFTQAAVYFSFFFLLLWVFDVPFAYYSGHYLEQAYQLSNQGPAGWALDLLKKTLLSFGLSLLLVLGLYFFIQKFPATWWIWAWAGFAVFSCLLGQLFPVLIVPLFYRYGRVEDEALKARIFQLVARFHLPLKNVFSLNLSKTTKKANAMFAGLGRTKRLVLADTLIQNFSADEIESVVAHELGHYRHHDIWRQLVFELAISFAGFALAFKVLKIWGPRMGYAGASDLAALPFLYLLLYGFGIVLTPAVNAYSRRMEREADRFALEACGPSGFIPAMEKLGRLNLADPKPHPLIVWWFHSHPPIGERIEMARRLLLFLMALVFSMPTFASAETRTPPKETESEEEATVRALESRTRTGMKSFFLGTGKETEGVNLPIAIDLYNQGVQFYEKKEFELARLALQDSLTYDAKNPLAHELLGDIAYFEQRLNEALKHYEAAYRLKARQGLEEKMEKVRKERPIEAKLATYEEEHFLIKYRGEQAGIEGAPLKDFLRNSFREVGQDLGYFFQRQIVVILYDEQEYRRLNDVPHWSSGVYDGKISLPAYGKGLSLKEVQRVIRHEMTHAFIADISRGRCPSWLNEGLAEYEEARLGAPDFRVFHAAIRSQSLFPIADLLDRKKTQEFQDPLEAQIFYEESHQLTAYLVKRYGMFKVKKMLEYFGQGKDSFEVIQETLKISPLELEKQWKETLPSG